MKSRSKKSLLARKVKVAQQAKKLDTLSVAE
jgi:hypothetical protein